LLLPPSQKKLIDLEHALHLISEKLQMWLSMMIKMLPNLLLAPLILVIASFWQNSCGIWHIAKLTNT